MAVEICWLSENRAEGVSVPLASFPIETGLCSTLVAQRVTARFQRFTGEVVEAKYIKTSSIMQ